MTYRQSIQYLKRLGNEVQTMKFGLDTIQTLLSELNAPHLDYRSVLVAGTNGKGSVARFLSEICGAADLKTGLFTSPHLIRLEERIKIDGVEISKDSFASALTEVVDTINRLRLQAHPTYFETVTATALLYFSQQEIDIAILEVGMGGRLDSTNVVTPVVSIITSISYDHQQYLGGTLEEIAREKAGIMRQSGTTIIAPQEDHVTDALRKAAAERGAYIREFQDSDLNISDENDGCYSFSYRGRTFGLRVRGELQTENAALACMAADELKKAGYSIPERAITEGIEQHWDSGVLQKVSEDPFILVDGGHNLEAVTSLASHIDRHIRSPRTLVFGCMKDKDAKGLLSILRPRFQEVYLTQVASQRTAPPSELKTLCPEGRVFVNSKEAFESALSAGNAVVVTGSFFLAGEILAHFRELSPNIPSRLPGNRAG